MEDGDGEDQTPFWVQSTTNVRRADLLRRRASAFFFSSGLVVFLLLVTAVFFLVFVVPSSITFSAQILKPNSVRKSWDSLNIVLVLVAVVFGFLSRNKNEDRYHSYYDEFQASSAPNKEIGSHKHKYNYETNEGSKSNISNSSHWFEYSDFQQPKSEHKNSIFTRNSSSYPDLREISTAHWSFEDDVIHVDSGRVWDPEMDRDPGEGKILRRHRSLGGGVEVEQLRAPVQDMAPNVDTLLSESEEGANLPTLETEAVETPQEIEEDLKVGVSESGATRRDGSNTELKKDFEPLDQVAEPPQPPEAADPGLTVSPELTYERMGRKKERSNRKRNNHVESKDPVSTASEAAPSPPSPPRQKSVHRKRAGATGSSTKDFLNSLYSKKKKKQRQKSVDHLDHLLHEAQAPLSFQVPPPSHPPPPPPAPPPTSVFQNLFSSKKHKRKRTITVTLAPQPSSSPLSPEAAHEPEPTSHTAPLTTHKPPKPAKMISFDKLEEVSNSGGDSPLNRIPPPPPLPPVPFFKSPAWKFVVQGDYVRVNSSNSSRSGSPDTYDGESDITPSAVDAAGGATSFHPSPLFCASPDVDTKAESFITNFRATLKLEKIHSMKKRDVGPSGLGPGPGRSQFSKKD